MGVVSHFDHTSLHTCSLIEEGGDWDRRNRLKTYEGLYAMSVRDFKKAAVCFFDTMATFTSTELMDYRTFCKYATISCMLAQDRKEIKEQVRAVTIHWGRKLCPSIVTIKGMKLYPSIVATIGNKVVPLYIKLCPSISATIRE